MKTFSFILVVLLIACAAARGNAGVFGGSGQDIKLMNSKDVQMVSEEILIRPGPVEVTREAKIYRREKADYICTFKLKNLSDHPVDVQVGFPLNSQFFQQPYHHTTDLAEITNGYHFVVLEGEKSYPVRYSREDKNNKFKSIFLWDMAFAAGEQKELRITYTMPFSMGAAATYKEWRRSMYTKPWYAYFEEALGEGFGYVTETGKSWNGKIEHARFRIDLRTLETLLNQRGMPEEGRLTAEQEARLEKQEDELDAKMQLGEAARKRGEEFRKKITERTKKIREERMARSAIDNPAIFREITPAEWKEDGDGSIVWDVKDYVPGNPIRVGYYFILCMPQTKEDTKQLIEKAFKNRLIDEDAQDLEDIIKAFYGIKVDNPRIAGFLENQKWYPAGGQKKLPPGIIETIEEAKENK